MEIQKLDDLKNEFRDAGSGFHGFINACMAKIMDHALMNLFRQFF
jgi:hypothetical protein